MDGLLAHGGSSLLCGRGIFMRSVRGCVRACADCIGSDRQRFILGRIHRKANRGRLQDLARSVGYLDGWPPSSNQCLQFLTPYTYTSAPSRLSACLAAALFAQCCSIVILISIDRCLSPHWNFPPDVKPSVGYNTHVSTTMIG